MMKEALICELAQQLGVVLNQKNKMCSVAESCTGGMLGAVITEIPGSSKWFERGFITYSNQAKVELLGVPHAVITKCGAVSQETAHAMAEGAILASDADVSVAITGIAGPEGGSSEKPVGTVWIAWAGNFQPTSSQCFEFQGNRQSIRQQAVKEALLGLIKRCTQTRAETTPRARYFFALWPNPEVVEHIKFHAAASLKERQCYRVRDENFHLTLAFLGAVPEAFLQYVCDLIGTIKVAPFNFKLTSLGYWSKSKTAWLGTNQVSTALDLLAYEIQKKLVAAGFKPERRPFVPHVTIARRCKIKPPMQEIAAIEWTAQQFCLVKSMPTDDHSNYEIIEQWPLIRSEDKTKTV